ncbi:ABC transporter substrate-binding protein [Salmonella enterica]|uniref:ABC transporter substrate-binding protein n=1 Tax=Salmonella enterica TaxID=28901 RepID=UPI001F3D4E60|nr:ABC transporter substrate-binding protein [Salmonella enterica]MDJ4288755.1 ABC transporter substrate-binding protein [Salmonella enterica]UJJ10560.1 ABC transporter substrate-binding protein [Salmonella enterica subsp. enterica]
MILRFILFTLVLASSMVHAEQTVTNVTDLLGRTVKIKLPVQRVILGEGRQLYLVAMLDKENPAQRIVAWRKDLIQSDPATWQQYRQQFPQLEKIPTFGGSEQGTFDIEQAIKLKPDVIIMNMDARNAIVDSGYEAALTSAGIPIIYVDFRYDPISHIPPTVKIFGELFGKSDQAEAYLKFRDSELRRVISKVSKLQEPLPKVFLERLGGYSEECCMTFGKGSFGRFVKLAGGKNIAANLAPGSFFTINPEKVIALNPDIVILTSGNFQAFVPGGRWIPLGPGVNIVESRRKLAWFTTRPAYENSTARRNNAFFAIWHQFYNSPYDVIAIQQLAKWIHPQLFEDLDPDDTFRRLHQKFLPVPYQSGYMVSLQKEESNHDVRSGTTPR